MGDMPPPPNRKASFPPVTDARTRVLILGSLPGEASLAAARYYAHPQNLFWRLVGAVIDAELAAIPYKARLAALLAAGVGVWDVVADAARSGSLDVAIRDHRPNDLAALTASLPALQAVAFNGKTAERIGRAALGPTQLATASLPSSSPAYASLDFAAKRDRWLALRAYL